MWHDPETPAGYQDADLEMLELAEAANEPDRPDPWLQCDWCHPGNQSAVATIDILMGSSTRTLPYCPRHKETAFAERDHYRESRRHRYSGGLHL